MTLHGGEGMKKVGILPNLEKDKDFAVTNRLLQYLKLKECQSTDWRRKAEKEEADRSV